MGVQLQVEIVCVLQPLGHVGVVAVELARVAPCLPIDLPLQKRRVAPAEFLLEQRGRRVQHVRHEHDGEPLEPLPRKGSGHGVLVLWARWRAWLQSRTEAERSAPAWHTRGAALRWGAT